MSLWEIYKKIKGLDKKIVAAKEEIENIKNEAIKNNKFSIFEYDVVKESLEKCEELNSYDKFAFFYDIIKNVEKYNKLSIEDGEFINNLMNDKDNVAAIHRSYLGPVEVIDGKPTNILLEDIMHNGLINNGHAMQGGIEENPSLVTTTTRLKTFGDLMNVYASYKDNNVVVFLQFPKEIVKDNLAFQDKSALNEVYETKEDIRYIKPKYIIGAIVKGKDRDIFYKREQFLKDNNKTK